MRENECCFKGSVENQPSSGMDCCTAGISSTNQKASCCQKGSLCPNYCCYQQPPRRESFRPIENYSRPVEPIENCTIYRNSYFGNCAANRAQPIRPVHNITLPSAPIECQTIQKLSYQGHCGIRKLDPIRPIGSNNLKACGPLQSVTTQKHDFVAKRCDKRQPIIQLNNILNANVPMEKLTVNRLSYMPVDVCSNPRPKAVRPEPNYSRPEAPIEKCTIQKLSYQGNFNLPQREEVPWAKKIRIEPPPYDIASKSTTYGLSYLPNCNPEKSKPIRPYSEIEIFGPEIPPACTVYKLSYMPTDGSGRPKPIKPQSSLQKPTGSFEKCTIYKLSYQPNCDSKRPSPIKPSDNTQKSCEPMQSVTTQKHDFVAKPYSKPQPIYQCRNIPRDSAPLEQCTINRLSYQPIDVNQFRPSQPIRPVGNTEKPKDPISNCTTYKLSYMANCPQPTERISWAGRISYERPTAPLETCTIQKLSYMPPGCVQQPTGCSCCKDNATSNCPKAGM